MYNLTSCPVEKPFVNYLTGECFDCPGGSVYNIGMKVCQCKDGDYNASLNLCVTNCGYGEVFNTRTKKCGPPQENPVPINNNTNGNGTISSCPPSKPNWNPINKICEVCPLSTPRYNRLTSSCQSCQYNTIWNNNSCVPVCSNTPSTPVWN